MQLRRGFRLSARSLSIAFPPLAKRPVLLRAALRPSLRRLLINAYGSVLSAVLERLRTGPSENVDLPSA